MKKFLLLTHLLLRSGLTYGQDPDHLGIDCNPRLNQHEIAFFGNLFSGQNYDFRHKTIGFAAPHPSKLLGFINFPGFDASLLPMHKKEYFRLLKQDKNRHHVSTLLVFNDSLKRISKGFDAVIVLVPAKKVRKVTPKTTTSIATDLSYRTLNYPDNLDEVGTDTAGTFTPAEIRFFNTLFGHERGAFDFNDKKIAFVDLDYDNPYQSDQLKRKNQYVDRVKKHLENDFLYPYDHLLILTADEKRESGGYDAIIMYSYKGPYRREKLLQLLKKNPT
jgi:hypothetical protein